MKKLILLSCCVFALAAQGIEISSALAGWTLSNKNKIRFDAAEKVSGTGSIRLDGAVRAVKKITLEKSGQYKLTFSVKGKELDKGTQIVLNSPGVKRWYPVSSLPKNEKETGTFDWHTGTAYIDTEIIGGETVTLTVCNYGSGTAWYGDIKITPLDRLPDGWRVRKPPVFMDDAVKLSDRSFRLENDSQAEKLFELEDDAEYELTFYVRGKNIAADPKKGAQILICGEDRKRWARVDTNPEGKPETGTFEWKKGRRRFSGKYFKSNKIYVLPTLNCSGTAWFDRIELKKIDREAGKTSFRQLENKVIREAAFYPLGVAGFFDPGQKITLHLDLAGEGEFSYLVRLLDYGGKEVASPLTGQGKMPGRTVLTLPGQKNGYYIAEAELLRSKQKIGRIQCGIAVAPEPSRRDPFFQFGFGVYPELHDAYRRVGAKTIALKLTSTGMAYGASPEKYVDRMLSTNRKFLESGDFKITLSVGATMRRSTDPEAYAAGRPILTDKAVDNILRGLKHVASRTKGHINEWSVGSEIPSGATMPRYAGTWCESMFNCMTIVRMASRIAKKADPGIKIFWGGNNVQRYTRTVEPIVFGDLVKEVDGYFIDAYTGNWNMTLGGYSVPESTLLSFYKESSELSEKMGKGKYIKNDEIGYAIHYGAPYDRGLAAIQAELTTRTIILTRTAPVLCLELHMPSWRGENLRNIKDTDRLMTTIWKQVLFGKEIYDVPLPGGAAYAVAARLLAFASFKKKIVSGMNYACVFTQADGKTLAALWNTEAKTTITLDLPQGALLTDMVGAETPLFSGKNAIHLSPAPVYLTCAVPPAELAAILEKALRAAPAALEGFAKRHDGETMTVFVKNPGSFPVDAAILGDGKVLISGRAAPGVSTFRVPFRGKLELLSDGQKSVIPRDDTFIRVKRLEKKPVFDGTGAWIAGLAVNKLRVPRDVWPKSALQPELAYFKTSFNPNGHDFAADYYLGYDDENLYIAVKADDPEHINKVTNGYLWDGDSIQWVLSDRDIPPVAVRSRRAQTKEYVSELNYGLALTAQGMEYRRFLGRPGLLSYPARVTRKGNETFYELALPWRESGLSPRSDRAVRFSLVVFDKTMEVRPGASYQLAVTPGVARFMDAGFYRLLVFEK